MKILNYTVLYEPLAEGGYMVIVPALPGISTSGSTLDEAREVIPILERVGFYVHHQTGSHVLMKHRTNPALRITIPFTTRHP